MKKLLLSLLLMAGFCFGAAAQTEIPESGETVVNTEKGTFKVYCEIVSNVRNLFSNKTNVEFDFGQASKFWSNDRQIVDENGRPITFNSVLDAVNYMSYRGWVFEQMYIVQSMSKGDSGSPAYHWIMSKEVSDISEITKGLYTQANFK
ncbi:MAG: hypothetical protein IKO77_02745 [Bacteroidales bacterium]|nr:hypothetical protein [Bacteroidales bacterium]